MSSMNREYEILDPNETDDIVLYTLYKLGESNYLELSNVIFILDALLTKEEGKRLPYLRGSISNGRGIVMRGLADNLECLSGEKIQSMITIPESYKLKPETKKVIEEVEKRIRKIISPKSFECYMEIINMLLAIEDRDTRFGKSVEYALGIHFQKDKFFKTLFS